jgi:hypothetical protein
MKSLRPHILSLLARAPERTRLPSPRRGAARLALSLVAGLLVASCAADDSAFHPRASLESGTLTAVGSTVLHVLPSGHTTLRVNYSGTDRLDDVEFVVIAPEADDGDRSDGSLAEMAVPPGASLDPPMAMIAPNGDAQTELTVGSTPGKFQVRARVAGGAPVTFDIQVREALSPTLSVWVSYDGMRDIRSHTATVLPGLTCEEALLSDKSQAEVRTEIDKNKAIPFSLGPNLSYAVVAWGRDATDAEVAAGCELHVSPITASMEEAVKSITVPLVDRPMRLLGNYPVEITLDLQASMERLQAAALDTVQAALPAGDEAEARGYLNALRAYFVAAQKSEQADAVGLLGDDVVETLAATLEQKAVGQLSAVRELAALLSRVGKQPSMAADYGVGVSNAMTLTVGSLVARSDDGTLAFDLTNSLGAKAPVASIIADYSDPKAEVNVSALTVSVGLGSYGRALIDALATAGGEGWYMPWFARAAGCDVLAGWLAQEETLSTDGAAWCDAACSEAVCSQALGQLLGKVRDGYPSLDTTHPTISLMGALSAHDRVGNDQVDDLGPSQLTGNWGKASGAETADEVSGMLVTRPQESPLNL